MEIPILIDTIAAGATLAAVAVALYFGVKSLRQTREIQQSERKQRQITDIEEWAKDVIRFIDEYDRGRGTVDLWYHIKWRWQILRATKTNMVNTAHHIDKDFRQKVERAVTSFDASDKNIDKGMIGNVQNDLNVCRRSCEEILESGGSLKFGRPRKATQDTL
jgi:putative protein kinase ArgK-like GTPase of G3E family